MASDGITPKQKLMLTALPLLAGRFKKCTLSGMTVNAWQRRAPRTLNAASQTRPST
jgi:hypothetical protein